MLILASPDLNKQSMWSRLVRRHDVMAQLAKLGMASDWPELTLSRVTPSDLRYSIK